MAFFDYLRISPWVMGDPANNFDRTNIDDGIYQARSAISEALSSDNPLLESTEFSAIALWVSSPLLRTPSSEIPGASTTSSPFITIPKQLVKIYFRVPILHSNIPLPSKFGASINESFSKLKPEARDELLISCHPYLYADYEKFSEVTAGDQIEIRFDNKSYSTAKIIKIEKKSVNNIGSEIVSFVSSIIDIFDDAGETAILGVSFEPSTPDEIKKFALLYDESSTVPNKEQHIRKGIERAHTEMIPYIKAFIYRSWAELKVKIQINSTYRSPEEQKKLLVRYNTEKLPPYLEKLKKWEEAGSPKGSEPEKPPGKPGKTSWHLTGAALDFNAYLEDGTKYGKTSPHPGRADNYAAWKSSGISAIGESLGLRWGGHWSNYDPIHFDMGNIYTEDKRKALMKKATAAGQEPNRTPFV